MRWILLGGALALAGCAANARMEASRQADAGRELADALKGRVAGKPSSCINTGSVISSPRVIGNQTILYRSGRRIWRNELPERCPALTPYATLIVEQHGSQLCRNDHVRVLEPGATIPSQICRLGDFIPYDRP